MTMNETAQPGVAPGVIVSENGTAFTPDAFALPKLQQMEEPVPDMSDMEKAQVVPNPTGYKLLCALPEIKETFEGTSIVRPESFAREEAIATTVLFVLKVGPDAYKDEKKFPSGPWCKQGDFVLVRTYSGTRFRVFGKEFRVINDDQVEAVVEDPRGVTRFNG